MINLSIPKIKKDLSYIRLPGNGNTPKGNKNTKEPTFRLEE